MHHTHARTAIAPRDLFIPEIEDDTEEAPWMVMGDAQFWAASYLANSLDNYALTHHRPWYVAGMLPILYRRPGERRNRQVAPDVMVSFVERRPRDSYDLAAEGTFPAFVLEVLSPESVDRDREKKRLLYEALGAREYVLFSPQARVPGPPLQGYRRGTSGLFETWPPDDDGRLWSEVLGLSLAAQGPMLRALDEHGQPLLTYAESEAARGLAEEELARLRALLEQQRNNE